MSLFNALLHGLKAKIDAQNAYKDFVIASIKETINITLTHDNVVSLKDSVLVLHISPTIKTALVLKKDAVIQSLQNKGLKVSNLK